VKASSAMNEVVEWIKYLTVRRLVCCSFLVGVVVSTRELYIHNIPTQDCLFYIFSHELPVKL